MLNLGKLLMDLPPQTPKFELTGKNTYRTTLKTTVYLIAFYFKIT